jgi:UDP-N-acetylmuramoyl-L-alanyl-D-glutamate--2,6-diaminopimelate ligase
VFVALVDADADGHDSAMEAVRRRAAAVICERPLPIFDVPQCVVPCSRTVYGRLCQALVGNPSQQLKVIGVTGTHGKTTVARLLTSIFRHAGTAVGTLDSFGYWDGWDDRPPLDGQLTPPVLARSLAGMAAAGASHAVVEFSSRELSGLVAAGVLLDAACITHVGRNHLDWHGTLENYRQAKRRIFAHLQPDGVAILNADDQASVRMLSDLNFPALTFGLRQPAEVTADIVEQHANEQVFVLSAGDESVGVRTAIIGDHHVYNCLAAATTALAYGVDLTAIAHGLEAVDRLPGRMERVTCGQEFAVFVDAADTPDALRAALRAARQVTGGRLICVFGGHAEDDPADWPAMGRVAGAMADVAVITNNQMHEASDGLCIQLLSGLVDRRKARIISRRGEAIAWAIDAAQAGDTVVIAGMGERVHRVEYGLETPLNDADLVRQTLGAGGLARLPQQTAA